MKNYLLAVHDNPDVPVPAPEVMQQAFKAVDEFNAELQAKGAWVFAGGLHPASTATVVTAKDGEVLTTDGPFAETKEHLGGFWIVAATDLDEALAVGGQGVGRLPWLRSRSDPSRTSPRSSSRRHGDTTTSPNSSGPSGHESGKAVATLVRLFGDIDVAEEAVQEAFLIATQKWPTDGPRRTPGPGSSPPLATAPSTASAASRPAMTATPRPRSCTSATSPSNRSGP